MRAWLRKHWWGTAVATSFLLWGVGWLWADWLASALGGLGTLLIYGLVGWKVWVNRRDWAWLRRHAANVAVSLLVVLAVAAGGGLLGLHAWWAWTLYAIPTAALLMLIAAMALEHESTRALWHFWREHRKAAPEPEYPPLEVRMVDVDAKHVYGPDEHGNIAVVGAAVKDAMRVPGFCCEQPDEYVMDRGGHIVESGDPTVHPGALHTCQLPEGHGGMHSWRTRVKCGHRDCPKTATVLYRASTPKGTMYEAICDEHEDDFRQRAEGLHWRVSDRDRTRLVPLDHAPVVYP